MSVTIRLAKTLHDLAQVYRFRYGVYVEEMRRPQKYADHHEKRIEEPLDATGIVLGAWDDGRVVGTVRVNLGRDGAFDDYTVYYQMEQFRPFFPHRVSITTKLIVDPEYRGTLLPIQMAVMGFRLATERGIVFDFMDCNSHLKSYFERLGYRQLFSNILHPEYGNVHPMVLAGLDLEHLQKCRSPFRKAAALLKDSDNSAGFFQSLIVRNQTPRNLR